MRFDISSQDQSQSKTLRLGTLFIRPGITITLGPGHGISFGPASIFDDACRTSFDSLRNATMEDECRTPRSR